jgi:hypothetical protein
MSDKLVKRDEVYDANAVTIKLSNLKFSSEKKEEYCFASSNDAAENYSRSSSNCEESVDEEHRTSECISIRKHSKLELHGGLPKDRLEEEKSPRRYSESHSKKRANFRNFVKKTLQLAPSSKSLMPNNIANTLRDRITEVRMEKYADITKRFESKYQILDYFLGEGSTGLVKQCLNKETNKIYAAKIIRTNDIEVLKAIKNEFHIQKLLTHPNIVKAYEMFYNPITSRVKIMMEMVNGCELFDPIRTEGPFPGN